MNLDNPTLQAFIRDIREGKDTAAAEWICSEWLNEQDVSLADMLRLYAGTGPDYTDGISQGVLVHWLRKRDPGKCELVEGYRVELIPKSHYALIEWWVSPKCEVAFQSQAEAEYHCKRSVLQAFPEVRYTITAEIRTYSKWYRMDQQKREKFLYAAGFHPRVIITYVPRYTVWSFLRAEYAAPQLVPESTISPHGGWKQLVTGFAYAGNARGAACHAPSGSQDVPYSEARR